MLAFPTESKVIDTSPNSVILACRQKRKQMSAIDIPSCSHTKQPSWGIKHTWQWGSMMMVLVLSIMTAGPEMESPAPKWSSLYTDVCTRPPSKKQLVYSTTLNAISSARYDNLALICICNDDTQLNTYFLSERGVEMAGTGIRRTFAAWPMALTRMLSITTGLSLHIDGWVIIACINDHLMTIKCRGIVLQRT